MSSKTRIFGAGCPPPAIYDDEISSVKVVDVTCVTAPILFQDRDFGGESLVLADWRYENLRNQDFNDIASSICVPQGFTVQLFSSAHFENLVATIGGPRGKLTFGGESPSYNDTVSSVEVFPVANPDELALFERANFGRRRLVMTEDSYSDLADQNFDDIASSIWAPAGASVKLYRNPDFSGLVESLAGPTGVRDFSEDYLGYNDAISSVQINEMAIVSPTANRELSRPSGTIHLKAVAPGFDQGSSSYTWVVTDTTGKSKTYHGNDMDIQLWTRTEAIFTPPSFTIEVTVTDTEGRESTDRIELEVIPGPLR